MAGKRGVRVTILGEDYVQVSFARRVLVELGFSRHEINDRPVPNGDGSGEKWVRTDYPKQVALNRSKRSHQQCTLLVSIDADNRSIVDRRNQLDQALTNAELAPRGNDEPIAIWVPTRNIESWLKHFAGEVVNEETNYKNKVNQLNLNQAAAGFVAEFRQWELSPGNFQTLPSLLDAYTEWKRIV